MILASIGSGRSDPTERVLKELLKSGGNRRCVDCGALVRDLMYRYVHKYLHTVLRFTVSMQGPHYVVSKFNVFVCSSCSGVHRQFGHRVKAISLCEFSLEEVDALRNGGGNDVFNRTYCATLPGDYVKPKSSSLDLIKCWIEDVYELKKFYRKIDNVEAARPPRLDIAPDAIAIVPLADLLGADTPILQVSPAKLEGDKEETKDPEVPKHHMIDKEVDQTSQKEPEGNLLGDWDPFESSVVSDALATEPQEVALATEHQETHNTPIVDTKVEVSFEQEWESFVLTSEVGFPTALEKLTQGAEDSRVDSPSSEVEEHPSLAALNIQDEKIEEYPVKVKEEIPLEAFYPEFEQIRATGFLPTGKPVPWDTTRVERPREPENESSSTYIQDENYPEKPVHSSSVAPTVAAFSSRPSANPTDKAVKALFGAEKNLTAYDLSAPLPAKPAMSGNPFG